MSRTDQIVGVLDYQAGNVHSIANALEYQGANVRRVSVPDDFSGLSHVILPGVGAFGFCRSRLDESGLLPRLTDWALERKMPLLGICVGMQLLADISTEHGENPGLGWCGGRVEKLEAKDNDIRVPHVGWNTVRFIKDFGLFRADDESTFYFDHSYAYTKPALADSIGTCNHGVEFCAVVRRDNIVASQFHPEKSQSAGMRFLKSFLDMRPGA